MQCCISCPMSDICSDEYPGTEGKPPCASEPVVAANSASANTGSPKLLSFEKLWKMARDEFPYPPDDNILCGRFYADVIYDYIAKQLRAGA